MTFDPHQDPIAITVPRFTLHESQDGPLGTRHLYRNEPFLLTLSADQRGTAPPRIAFNTAAYPNVMEGDTIEMLGDGHLVYGPENPGDWVAVSVLLMESDAGLRRAGVSLGSLVSDAASEAGLKALLSSNPTVLAVGTAVELVGNLVSQVLTSNRDDELLRVQGTFLRGSCVPYDINRKFTRTNRAASLDVKVIPLAAANGQGPTGTTINL